MAEDVGEVEVGPFGLELGEGDDGGDKVCGACLEEVRKDATSVVWIGKVDSLHAEFVRDVSGKIHRRPLAGLAAELVGDRPAAGSELSAAVAVAMHRWVVRSEDASQ